MDSQHRQQPKIKPQDNIKQPSSPGIQELSASTSSVQHRETGSASLSTNQAAAERLKLEAFARDNSGLLLKSEPEEREPLQEASANNNRQRGSRTSVNFESQRLLGGEYYCCCGKLVDRLRMPNSARLAVAYFLAELVGTFLLVVIGDGAIASYVVTKRQVDVFSACLAFGVGAMIATFAAGKISGAHINPAASFAFALDGKLKWRLVPIYICAQYLGGFLGALALIVNYTEAIKSLDGGHHSAFGSANSTGHIFATYPGEWLSVWGSLLDQILGTGVLLFSLSAVSDRRNANLEARHQPLIVALVIGLVCVAFSPNCGAIFNPARDLAPRLVTALFGYPSVWSPLDGLYWFTAGVLGPHIGAIVGVFAYKLLIGNSLSLKLDLEDPAANKTSGSELCGGPSLRQASSKFNQPHQAHFKASPHLTASTGSAEFNYGSAMH